MVKSGKNVFLMDTKYTDNNNYYFVRILLCHPLLHPIPLQSPKIN